jgi:hypothetical protein
MGRASLVVILVGLALVRASWGGPKDFTGADACGSCHPTILASWKRTAHARASDGSVLGARAGDGACLTCHATSRKLPGVQCESCHGPGAAYSPADIMRDRSLARALGLREAMSSCMRCHVGSTSPRPFDPVRGWAAIRH